MIESGDLLYNALLVDKAGSLLNTLQASVAYDDLLADAKHNTKNGIFAEASVEWGPGFFLNTLIGGSDFVRLNATFRDSCRCTTWLPTKETGEGQQDQATPLGAFPAAAVDLHP